MLTPLSILSFTLGQHFHHECNLLLALEFILDPSLFAKDLATVGDYVFVSWIRIVDITRVSSSRFKSLKFNLLDM